MPTPPTPPPPALPHAVPPPLHPAPQRRTSRMAVASLVLGVISVMGAAVLLIPTLLAIILGHVAMTKIRREPRVGGHGLALAGCILGYVSIVFGIMGVAMAIPAFEKVREESMRKTLLNDARQIAAAAQQYMMENGVDRVAFSIDPETGAVAGPIAFYVRTLSPGTRQIDGLVELEGSFSLVHPRAYGGAAVTFDSDGRQR
jgi:hypothetical protein